MKDLIEQLLSVVEAAEPKLRETSEVESTNPILPGGWSRKQVLGHLIDSASNNHQRFVRAALQPSLDFPGYDQDGNIRVQAPQQADWSLLVSLWAVYNRYLAHIIARLPCCQAGNSLPHRPRRAGHPGLPGEGLCQASPPSPQPDRRRAFEPGGCHKIGSGRAWLQPCRSEPMRTRALAAEVRSRPTGPRIFRVEITPNLRVTIPRGYGPFALRRNILPFKSK
jgi:hypothetical protein